jgi:hypothetical protein
VGAASLVTSGAGIGGQSTWGGDDRRRAALHVVSADTGNRAAYGTKRPSRAVKMEMGR